MCRKRDASHTWQGGYVGHLEAHAFCHGKTSSAKFYFIALGGIRALIRSDGFVALLGESGFAHVEALVGKRYTLKCTGKTGLDCERSECYC